MKMAKSIHSLSKIKTVLNISIVIIAIIFGTAIVKQNYYLFFIILALFTFFVLIKSDIIPISIILIIIPMTGWAVGQGIIPMQVMWLPELLSLLLFVKALINRILKSSRIRLFGIKIVIAFLTVSIVSLLINGLNIISWLLFLRLLFRYYLLFLAIINLDLDKDNMKFLNTILIFVFIAQLPMSLIKLFIYGQGEIPVGLSAHAEPSIIPIIAIGFLLSFYFFYQKKPIYIVGIIAFIGFSIIGEKRAFILFLPVALIYFFWVAKGYLKISLKLVVLSILAFTFVSYFTIRMNPSLNPQDKFWGEFDLQFFAKYILNYTTHISETGLSTGRVSTMINVFNNLSERGFVGLAFGYGPGCILKSMFASVDSRENISSKFGVRYGINGLNWLGIQTGYVGAALYAILLLMILKNANAFLYLTKDPYWKSFGVGMAVFCFIMVLLSMIYSPFFINDSIAAIFFCLVGFLFNNIKSIKE